jgi:hypothetical protein
VEFVMLYVRMIKWSAAKEVELSVAVVDFMKSVEKIARKFTKFALIDAGSSKFKPSVMGAAFVFLGF